MKKYKANRDTEFEPKLIGGSSDKIKKTGIYHPKNVKLWNRFRKTSMNKTFVTLDNDKYGLTCDPTKPCEGLTFHDYAGNRLLDWNAHVGVQILGYNHPKVVEAGKKIAEYNVVSFIGAGTDFLIASEKLPDIVQMNETLVKQAKKAGFKKIGKVGGWSTGTEAVENCMKVAYDVKKRKLFQRWGKNAEKNWAKLEKKLGYPLFGIAGESCFHGRTMGSVSMTNSKKTQYQYYPHIPNIHHIPYLSKNGNGKKFSIYEKVNTEVPLEDLLTGSKLTNMLKKGEIPSDLLAFICLEPMQGEGGYKIPQKQYINEMTNFCQLNDVIYIDDEVQAGMGRSGKFFALSHQINGGENIVFSMAKGLHTAGVLIENEMDFEESGRASTTAGYGRLADIVIGNAKLEAILENNGALMKNATKMGNYMKKELQKINDGSLTRIDNLGLLMVTDFETPEIRNKAYEKIVEKGVLPLTVGTKGIRWLPPLDVKTHEVDYVVKVIDDVLKEL